MDLKVKNNIKRAIQEEIVKRLLVKYFTEKGFKESFEAPIYPPMIYDLPYVIPELMNSVEIVPFVEQIDPITNVVTMGWNLFVLGTNRMNLGSSTHNNLMEFRRSLMGQQNNPNMPSEMRKTPKAILEFVMGIIGRNKGAILEMPPGVKMPAFTSFMPPMGANRPKIGPTMSGGWYERNRPV
jgi:hypothetical protein